MNTKNISVEQLEKFAKQIRKDILAISHMAHTGHIGSAFSIVDILTVLYWNVLMLNPKKPLDDARDRFILSKGHAASALYPILYRRGFFSKKTLYSFCQEKGELGVHPHYNPSLGIELTTGSLGHGLSVGVGMAMALREKKKRRLPKVFVLLSDAELQEGSVWEAIMFASHHGLDNLIAIVDDNGQQAFGKTEEVVSLRPILSKWETFCWKGREVDGHNLRLLVSVFDSLPLTIGKPSVIIAKTVRGHGVSFMENLIDWHYLTMSEKQYKEAVEEIERL